jgi:uncharacterized protein
MAEPEGRPQRGSLETRELPLVTDGKRIRGLIPYGTESRDMGGWREVIEPTALRGTKLDDLVATVDHAGVPIGRWPSTLQLDDRDDGLHWSVDPPKSRQDLIEALERGDLRGGSWRMRVSRDRWEGDVRHIEGIAELRDVSVVTHGAYEAPVELRSRGGEDGSTLGDAGASLVPAAADTVDPNAAQNGATHEMDREVKKDENAPQAAAEERSAPREDMVEVADVGSLRVNERNEAPLLRTLTQLFESRGFPNEVATATWDEFRSLT